MMPCLPKPRLHLLSLPRNNNITLRTYSTKTPKALLSTTASPTSPSPSTDPPPLPSSTGTPPSFPTSLSTSLPSSSSPPRKHHDLTSFLAHARLKGLSPTSPAYLGTHYEYTVQRALARLGFVLDHTGQRSDRGIDLLGHWHLPTDNLSSHGSPSSVSPPGNPLPLSNSRAGALKVLVQCKALSRGPTPSLIREMEGIYNGAPLGWRNNEVFAVLATTGPATKGVLNALGQSTKPFVFFMVCPRGTVKQGLWNRAAEECGLDGVGVGVRYLDDDGDEGEDGQVRKEVVLNWKGRVLDLERKVENHGS